MGQRKQYAQSIYGAEPSTMDELGHAVVKLINAFKSPFYGNNGFMTPTSPVKCVGLAWDVTHSFDVRYTHCSPEGCKLWDYRDKNIDPPRYSGWYGRVWVRYSNGNYGGDAFRETLTHTLTHTGCGGGGFYGGPWDEVAKTHFGRYGSGKQPFDTFPEPKLCSWDYSIFDLDWPELIEVKEFTERACLRKFEGLVEQQPKHNFLWEDAETKAKDEAFLFDCKRVIRQKEVLSLLR
jgi:hypothetical protein